MFPQTIQIRNTQIMGRGVFAKSKISKGQILLKLEEENYITYDDFDSHFFFQRLIDFRPEIKDRKTQFAFYLAYVNQNKEQQRKNNQKTVNYIENQLPNYFNSLICWREDELKILNDRKLKKQVQDKKQSIKKSFNVIKQYLTKLTKTNLQFLQNENKKNHLYEFKQVNFKNQCKKISLEQVVHFYAAIQSRRIYYSTNHDVNSQIGALIPFLELFNHSSHGQVEKYDSMVKLTVDVQADQQIFICYGRNFSGQQLFFTYGIVQGISLKQCYKKSSKQAKIQDQRRILAQAYNSSQKQKE